MGKMLERKKEKKMNKERKEVKKKYRNKTNKDAKLNLTMVSIFHRMLPFLKRIEFCFSVNIFQARFKQKSFRNSNFWQRFSAFSIFLIA